MFEFIFFELFLARESFENSKETRGILQILDNLKKMGSEYLYNIFSRKEKKDEIIEPEEIVQKHTYKWLYSHAKLKFSSRFLSGNIDDIVLEDIVSKSCDDYFDFIKKMIKEVNVQYATKLGEILKTRDNKKIFEYIEKVYVENKLLFFYAWKTYCISEFEKSLFNDENLDIDLEIKENMINQLFEKYPKAKKHMGNIGIQKGKQLKLDFVKMGKYAIKPKLEDKIIENTAFFMDLSLQELFIFVGFAKLFLESEKNLVYKEYLKYFYQFLEKKFRDSHNDILEKEERKQKTQIQNLEKIENKKNAEEKIEISEITVVEKNELPEEMVFDLKEYFGGYLDDDLERSLRNSRKIYKTKWFEKFGVDQAFFEILDKYGFLCEDEEPQENVESKSVQITQEEYFEDNNIVEDERLVKLKVMIEKISKTYNIAQKVDLYIEALSIFYDIEDKKGLGEKMFNSIKSDIRILKGIESVLYKILNGQKEDIKTSGVRKRKRYFRFDVGYNTGYRIVLQDQDTTNRKILIDFAKHDTYSDNIQYYLKSID